MGRVSTRQILNNYGGCAALKIDPKLASSLYGRGVAEPKSGNATDGDKDAAAAKAIQVDVADQVAALGVTF
jgi:hypothetical protein